MSPFLSTRHHGLLLAASIAVFALGGPAVGAGRSQGAPVQLAQQDPVDDQGGDVAGIVLRIGRLEDQIRALTGQVEQLQFQNRKLEETLRKAQGDVDFRLQELEHGASPAAPRAPAPRRSETEPPASPDQQTAAVAPSPAPGRPAPRRTTGDAFNPDADPTAPGAPRPLGSTTPSPPLDARPVRQAAPDNRGAPLNLMRPQASPTDPQAPAPAVDAPAAVPAQAPRDPGAVASLAPGGTRDEYDADLGLFRQGQYDSAASGFLAFADKYARDRLVPDALYYAGESYARLGRQREAAEQFLKVSTDYGKSARAPDALLRLGVSLNALGAKEQACATYGEVMRRYPNASPDVRSGVDREMKRARCPANG